MATDYNRGAGNRPSTHGDLSKESIFDRSNDTGVDAPDENPTPDEVGGNFATVEQLDAAIAEVEAGAVDLTGYATETYVDTSIAAIPPTDLSAYATIASLSSYATTAAVTSALSSYATTASLSAYATTASLSAYATTAAVTSTLSSYATTAAVTSALSSYATTASLSSYVLSSTLTSTLTSYVTSASLTSTLASYATTASLSSYATTASLSSYATVSSVSDRMVVVNHGSTAGTARPSFNAVYWIGSVTPTNAQVQDLWYDTSVV
jgi:hypothetical protein